MKFWKYHGIGNDFIVLDCITDPVPVDPAWCEQVCDRHFGIGADGVLYILPGQGTDITMRIINADSSEAEMCGNGIRCFVKFVIEKGIMPVNEFTVETLSGIKRPTAVVEDGRVVSIGVDMGEPRLDCADIPVAADGRFIEKSLFSHGKRFTVTSVNTGVPHTVAFVDDCNLLDVEYYGKDIEHSPIFPRRTNVDFVQIIDRSNIVMRAWERGCGCTMCCGTGACASVVACILAGRTERRVNVHVEIGTLVIEWRDDNTLYMTGPAETVCEGTYFYN